MISFDELCRQVAGLQAEALRRWITNDWVRPVQGPPEERFEEIDVARVRLIVTLHQELHVDEEALPIVFDLAENEGLLLGGSSGINVAGAIRLARDLGPGHTIVTILCDSGVRYASKLYNPAFLRSKNLPVPGWMEAPPSALSARTDTFER